MLALTFKLTMKRLSRICLISLSIGILISTGKALEKDLTGSIKGATQPSIMRLAGGARSYAYRNYVILATPIKDGVGENIVVYQRPRGSTESEGYDLKRLIKYLVITNDSGNYFTGLDGDALFIISQTGPDGVFKIYDLTTGKKVFEGVTQKDLSK
jgi:hypothetical protein